MMDTLRIRHKTGDPLDGVASYLHSDQLGSVRVMTGVDGASDKEVTYRPFGEAVEFVTDPAALPETKGFIPLSGFDYIKPLPRQRENASTPTPVCNT
ncbi:hypothetical protein [Profundibacter sp.]